MIAESNCFRSCAAGYIQRPRLGLRRVLGPYSIRQCTFASVLHAASSASFWTAQEDAPAALKALSGIASIGSSASQRNRTSSARKHAIAHSPADSSTHQCRNTAYCGRAGSGVDELRAPQTEASLRSVQVVARHGARAPVADCGRWLPPPPARVALSRRGRRGRRARVARTGSAAGEGRVRARRAPGRRLRAASRARPRAARGLLGAGGRWKLPTDHITLRSSDLPRTRRSPRR